MDLFTFLISGTLLSLTIWVVQRRQWKNWVRLLFVIVLFLASAVCFYLQSGPATLGTERWYETSPYLEILFFILMLMGMAARYFTKVIEVRREEISKLQKRSRSVVKPKLEFDIWEFSYPLFISVVTFGALLTQIKEQTFSAGNAVLSFQTGFFWQTILTAKQGKNN
jgi:cell division protein FtsW (lipid II flippase)